MEDKLLEFIKKCPRTSFSEIEGFFEKQGYDYKGEAILEIEGYNIMLWANWNSDAISLVNDLVKVGKVELLPASWIEQMCFGKSFDLPIARKPNHRYKELHWMPVVASAVEGCGRTPQNWGVERENSTGGS